MEEDTLVGIFTLCAFFGLLVASDRKLIPQQVLPLQSLMVLAALAFLILSLLAGKPLTRGALFSVTTLHPITATLTGFLLAGTVEAAGGFLAAGRLMRMAGQSRWLGLPGAVFLLVNLPNLFAMPCGRVWAAALMPLVLMLSKGVVRATGNATLGPAIVVGFIINAAASCGPSPLGGIGMMGEGMAGYLPRSFANHMQWSIMVSTVLCMFFCAKMYKISAPIREELHAVETPLPTTAWFSCLLFFVGMSAIFLVEATIPLQALLLMLTFVVMLAGRVSLQNMLTGISFHPLTAMIAGFMVAGSLVVSGGFDAFNDILLFVAKNIPFGYALVGVVLVYVPLIFPMPCGRILSTSLLPGVLLFGQEVSRATGFELAVPLLLVPFLLSCAASCGPSQLGGIGGIGEGNLRLKAGVFTMPQQLSLIIGVAISGLSVVLFGVSTAFPGVGQSILFLLSSVACAMATNRLFEQPLWYPGGLLAGVLTGILMVVL